MSETLADVFANHESRESRPTITYDRFMEMLAERGLTVHPYMPPRSDLCVSIADASGLKEQYRADILPYFREEQMEEELDKISHPDYDWAIHGIRADNEEKDL